MVLLLLLIRQSRPQSGVELPRFAELVVHGRISECRNKQL